MYSHRRAQKAIKLKKYEDFAGVDFSTDQTLISNNRSPWAPNLISDEGGFPEKRSGYSCERMGMNKVNGIYPMEVNGETYIIIHRGDEICQINYDNTIIVMRGVSDNRSSGFVFGGKLWILTGTEYIVIEAVSNYFKASWVQEIAKVPTTCISRNPSGGGVMFEAVNLITSKRACSFVGTNTDTTYFLDSNELDEQGVIEVFMGNMFYVEGYHFSVNRKLGIVQLLEPLSAPNVPGQDNIKIVYEKTVPGYVDRICKCTFATSFGAGANDHIFLSGNKEYKNIDWHTAPGDPTYYPDTGYAGIGNSDSAIMGYLRVGEHLAIVKESSASDTAVFLRSVSYDQQNGLYFPIKAGISTVGAIAPGAIMNFFDDPLYLSTTGLFGITSRDVSQEKTLKARSSRINPKLINEPNLEKAQMVQWGNYCIISINSRCYVADGRKLSRTSQSEMEYEWFHWTDIPATVMKVVDGKLYFGSEDGCIYVFNDQTSKDRYSDDGRPIVASWSTKADDDGDFTRYKSMPSIGSGVVIKPYTRSSVKVFLETDEYFNKLCKTENMDIFNFEELDFERLSFNTSELPKFVPFNFRANGYKSIRITVMNDALNEGFGVFAIFRRFTLGRYIR